MKDPFQIASSQATAIGDYQSKVAAFAVEMTVWQQHSAKVGREEGFEAYPPPHAHKLIWQAIALADDGVSWIPHFVIKDDAPDAEVLLRGRKNALLAQVVAMEANQSVTIFPPGKRRLYELKEGAVIARDRERRKTIEEEEAAARQDAMSRLSPEEASDAAKVAAILSSGKTPDQVAYETINGRSKEDTDFMAGYTAIRDAMNAAMMHSAQVCSDIEDLTAETIEGWTIPAFPS